MHLHTGLSVQHRGYRHREHIKYGISFMTIVEPLFLDVATVSGLTDYGCIMNNH